jgi:hypothetical protein
VTGLAVFGERAHLCCEGSPLLTRKRCGCHGQAAGAPHGPHGRSPWVPRRVGVGLPVLRPSGRLLAAAPKVLVTGQAEIVHVRAMTEVPLHLDDLVVELTEADEHLTMPPTGLNARQRARVGARILRGRNPSARNHLRIQARKVALVTDPWVA